MLVFRLYGRKHIPSAGSSRALICVDVLLSLAMLGGKIILLDTLEQAGCLSFQVLGTGQGALDSTHMELLFIKK
jgi:hypothetical protein